MRTLMSASRIDGNPSIGLISAPVPLISIPRPLSGIGGPLDRSVEHVRPRRDHLRQPRRAALREIQARVFQREFDSFAGQCNFGLTETGIATDWVLSLDADYVLTRKVIEEIKALSPDENAVAFRAPFTYCIYLL